MAQFRRNRSESICTDSKANERVLWMDPDVAGRIYAYLEPHHVGDAQGEFEKYGVGDPDEFPLNGGILAVIFERDLGALTERMISIGFFDDSEKSLSSWLYVFQDCAAKLAKALLEVKSQEGPPPFRK